MKKKIIKRTFKFSCQIIDLVKKLPKNTTNYVLRKQLIRAATSTGANYREAIEAESKKDFIHKLSISKKEARETLYWLGLILYNNKPLEKNIKPLVKEVKELVKIFATSIKTGRKNIEC
jgi:four helix bundle protein